MSTHTHTRPMEMMLPERAARLGLLRMGSPVLEVRMWLHQELGEMK